MPHSPKHDAEAVVLHSSWTCLVGSLAGSALLLASAFFVVVASVAVWFKVVMALAAIGIVAAALLDMPVAAEFTPTGVTRRNLLRQHQLVWQDVDRLRRTRVGVWRHTIKNRGGGLIARVGWRSYLLVDRMESRAEFEAVRCVIGFGLADALGLGPDMAPPVGRKPTWRHRRAQWQPR